MRLSETRAWIVGAAMLAAVGSLIVVIALFTPIGQAMRGHLPGALRAKYIDLTLEVDSLRDQMNVQKRYVDNILTILNGLPTDSVSEQSVFTSRVDTFLPASEAERLFVSQFDARERFNISVLSPIAAEGMIFEPPTRDIDGDGPVSAIYRGTVVSVGFDVGGQAFAIVQHPNDFISVYSGMKDIYVEKGKKIEAGQRIGVATAALPLKFELWRAGSLLDAEKFINYPHKILVK